MLILIGSLRRAEVVVGVHCSWLFSLNVSRMIIWWQCQSECDDCVDSSFRNTIYISMDNQGICYLSWLLRLWSWKYAKQCCLYLNCSYLWHDFCPQFTSIFRSRGLLSLTNSSAWHRKSMPILTSFHSDSMAKTTWIVIMFLFVFLLNICDIL